MYEDLEPIANLKLAPAVEAIVKEMHKCIAEFAAKHSSGLSGRVEEAKINMRFDAVEKMCRTVYEIWLDLISRRTGAIRRDDIEFIMAKVEQQAHNFETFCRHLPASADILFTKYISELCQQRKSAALIGMRRELITTVLEQEAFPPRKAEMPQHTIHLNIQNSNIANLNLGSQLGTIEATLQTIANGHHENVAEALKQLTEGIADSSTLNDSMKTEAIEAVSVLAKQAEANLEERSSATVKAVLNWIPSLIGMAADLTTLWEKVGPTIKAPFGI